MRTLLIYITNSGGTYEAAKRISSVLRDHGHEVIVKKTVDTNPQEISEYELVILGSPSWDFTTPEGQRLEGQPQETMRELLNKMLEFNQLQNHKFAVYGLGDSSYTHLCGSVDEMEKVTDQLRATRIIDSLRIDSYYFDLDNNNAKIEAWATALANQLNE